MNLRDRFFSGTATKNWKLIPGLSSGAGHNPLLNIVDVVANVLRGHANNLVDISALLVLRYLLLYPICDCLLLGFALLLQLALLICLPAENFVALKFFNLFFPLEMSFLQFAGLLLDKQLALALFFLFLSESLSSSYISLLLLLPLNGGLFLFLSIVEFLKFGFFLA